MKEISTKDNINSLIATHPEIKDILFSLGFEDIVKPGMLQTAGRFMNLEKGSKMKSIPMEKIKAEFEKYNFLLK